MSQYDPYLPPEEPVDLNPYAAPKADLSKEYAPLQFDEMGDPLEPFSIDAVMRRAWYVFKDKLGLTAGVVLFVLAINYGIQLAIAFYLRSLKEQGASEQMIGSLNLVFAIPSAIFNLWLSIGQNIALLKLARGRRTEFAEVFRGGPYLVRVILASILMFLVFFFAVMVCIIPAIVAFAVVRNQPFGGGHVLGIIFGLLGLTVLIGLAARLYMFTFVIIDHNCGVIDSLSMSFEITRGHTFELIALGLVAILINIVGLIMCFVGLIFTVPLTMLMWSSSYALLVGKTIRGVKGKTGPDINFPDFEFRSL